MVPVGEHQRSTRLLERAADLAALDQLLSQVATTRRGRMALVGGEAGVGKTTLLRGFCDGHRETLRIFWGGCDALFTPRPLGPLFEIAERTGGELEELVAGGARPHEVASALAAELGVRGRTVLVLEDLHWADEATLDVLRLLARRVEGVAALVLASYRDDELERAHPLRIVLGELATSPAVVRLTIERLSPVAVAELAGPHAVDPGNLYRRTGGNPFFVTEVLAAATDQIPPTVRDAVLARAARLEPRARTLLEAVAVVPPQAELWLLEELAGDAFDRLADCLASGMLTPAAGAVAFRHELARLAVEESLTPDRALDLHRRALEALAAPPAGVPDLARLSHHAEAAGDGAAVLRFAPAAAARAASLGAHRESAAQYARALRFAESSPTTPRAELLERYSHQCYLSGQLEEGVEAQERAVAYRRELGDPLREGDSLRALARLLGFAGRAAEAETACLEAIALLEQLEPGPELARAYGKMAQRSLNWDDKKAAIAWGHRALELAERLGEVETVVYALNMIGGAEFRDGAPEGRERIEHSLEIARDAGLEDYVGSAYLNLVWSSIRRRRFPDAARYLSAGLDYVGERGLDYWWHSLCACRAWCELAVGRWPDAVDSAQFVLGQAARSRVARVFALSTLGLVRARRGDAGVWSPLDEALALAEPTGELQQIALAVAARAEAAWLEGLPDRAAAEAASALALALRRDAAWEAGELACWCRRLGTQADVEPPIAAPPWALQLAGDWEGAAQLWSELGCPYEFALALADAGETGMQRQALDALHALGARPAAAIVARRLRERGARGLPRGPRPATLANEANLTPRELEVLALVAEGLRNADIAARLFLSEKTVDHHVSAILRKLDARTRAEAGAKAVRLGLAGQDGRSISSGTRPARPG